MEKHRKLNPEQLENILDQHELWVGSEGQAGTRADLRHADLSNANLAEKELYRAKLGGACLTRAVFESANLKEADLAGADLTGAMLKRADLAGARLTGANLAGTDLRGAKLCGADFESADLNGARVGNRAQLAKSANLLDCSGIVFEHDELEQGKASSEQRADKIFSPGEKGEISFAIPAHLPPWRVAKVLGSLSLVAEGVRLSLTADFDAPEELAEKAANPALWTGADEPNVARLSALGLRNPIEGALEINRDLGQMILGLAQNGGSEPVNGLAAKLDRAEERLALAGETARRGLDKLKALLRGEDAKLGINGTVIGLED